MFQIGVEVQQLCHRSETMFPVGFWKSLFMLLSYPDDLHVTAYTQGGQILTVEILPSLSTNTGQDWLR